MDDFTRREVQRLLGADNEPIPEEFMDWYDLFVETWNRRVPGRLSRELLVTAVVLYKAWPRKPSQLAKRKPASAVAAVADESLASTE